MTSWRRAADAAGASRLWLPFTQMREFDRRARTFVRGDGPWLIDANGNRVFDAVSSIWTIIHGHGHPRIVEAIARQAATLDHATLLGASHPLAETLAQRLCELTETDYAFFSGDGASAIEVALKIALQYWRQRGEMHRRRFVRLTDAYHGDTAGAMSVSDIAVFKRHFDAVTFTAHPYDADPAVFDAPDVAAVVVEPIVQAAAGMRLVPEDRYAPLRQRTALLIVDEIATGFGRTGTMFASERLNLRPDIVCVGKGLSGGVLPISATLVRAHVYEAFLGDFGEMRQLFHGHSFAGNPIACAAALASLDLFEEEETLAHVAMLVAAMQPRLERLASHPAVREVRVLGTMAGIELRAEALDRGDAPTPAWRVANGLYRRGHFTRPIGEVIQFVPPLSSPPELVDAFFDALEDELAA